MKESPISPEILAHLLKIGLGRAVLHIKQDYDPAYRDTILHACLHNLAYDRQIEGDRAHYMLEVIQATGDFEFYRDTILDALIHATPAAENYDIGQVYSLAGYLAEDGDTEMREAITQKFLSMPALADFAGAHEIIALDELAGFIYVAEVLSDLIRQHGPDFQIGGNSYKPDDFFFWSLESQIGKDAAETALKELRTTHPTTTPFLDAIEESQKARNKKSKRKPRPTYAEIKEKIQKDPQERLKGIYKLWSKDATDAELNEAAQDLISETNPARLRCYLSMFWKRPFPLDPAPLFPLARHENFYVAIGAISALENLTRPAVRAFALECITDGWMVGRMVGILQGENHHPDDWALIETLTEQVVDEEDYHWLGFSVRHIFDQYPSPLAIPSLLNLYECDPCSFCREFIVEYLAKLDALPSWMREECLHDANFDLREMIQNLDNKPVE